jgi:hypothetical protein
MPVIVLTKDVKAAQVMFLLDINFFGHSHKAFCAQIQVLDVRAMNVAHNSIELFHEVSLKIEIQCCKVDCKVGHKMGGVRI